MGSTTTMYLLRSLRPNLHHVTYQYNEEHQQCHSKDNQSYVVV